MSGKSEKVEQLITFRKARDYISDPITLRANLRKLRNAREFLSDEANWIGGDVVFSLGMAVGKKADATCMMLAADRSMGQLASVLGFKTLREAFRWNDAPGRKHSEVLARLDDAIRDQEEQLSRAMAAEEKEMELV